jgi:hypothetical protein
LFHDPEKHPNKMLCFKTKIMSDKAHFVQLNYVHCLHGNLVVEIEQASEFKNSLDPEDQTTKKP